MSAWRNGRVIENVSGMIVVRQRKGIIGDICSSGWLGGVGHRRETQELERREAISDILVVWKKYAETYGL